MASQISEGTRIVFITGCSDGGIGSALATEFALKGCCVYASARSLHSLSELGDSIHKLEVDVTNDASCERAVKTIYAETGRIDVLVSNAGVSCVGALLDVSLETAQMMMDVNLYGTLRLVRLVGPQMAKRGKGLILPVGSTAGELSVPFRGHYNASKAALHAFTETLAEECRPLGVHVMLCSPGTVVSNIINTEAKTFNIPDDSLYIGYKKRMDKVLYSAQNVRQMPQMPADKFAKVVVQKALSSHPPTYMTAGGLTTLWAFLKWLPRPLAVRMLWNSAGAED